MIFRVFFDMIFAPDQSVLMNGTTIEDAVQRFMRCYPNAHIKNVIFERELGVEDEDRSN